jgi:hypothetical protein
MLVLTVIGYHGCTAVIITMITATLLLLWPWYHNIPDICLPVREQPVTGCSSALETLGCRPAKFVLFWTNLVNEVVTSR